MRVDSQKGPLLFHLDAQSFEFETSRPTFVSNNLIYISFDSCLFANSVERTLIRRENYHLEGGREGKDFCDDLPLKYEARLDDAIKYEYERRQTGMRITRIIFWTLFRPCSSVRDLIPMNCYSVTRSERQAV
jgi:hypothetical protein